MHSEHIILDKELNSSTVDIKSHDRNVASDIIRVYLQTRESDPSVHPHAALELATKEIERHHQKYPPQQALRNAARVVATAVADGVVVNVLYDGLTTVAEHLVTRGVLRGRDDLNVLLNRVAKDFSEFDPTELASRARAANSFVAELLEYQDENGSRSC